MNQVVILWQEALTMPEVKERTTGKEIKIFLYTVSIKYLLAISKKGIFFFQVPA